MFEIVFIIWSLFVIGCAFVENKWQNGIGVFFFLVSIPVMIYFPLMV